MRPLWIDFDDDDDIALLADMPHTRAGVSGASFSPLDLPALRIWIESEGLNSLADNDPISTWPDQSGLSNDFTQTGANRPTCKTGILNGLRVARFDGADDFMTSPYSPADENAEDVTYACVFRTDTTGATQIILWAGDAAGNGFGSEDEFNMGVGDVATTNLLDASIGGGAGPIASQLSPFNDTTNWHVIAGTFTGLNTGPQSDQLFVDNVGQTAGSGATTNSYAAYISTMFLGKPSAGGANTRLFDGDLAAAVVCAAALNSAQLTSLYNFWSAKYAL